MDPSSSVGKTCLGENIIEISSEKAKGHEGWNSPKYQDTTNSGGKKETKAIVFHKMETEEISDRFVAPCFVKRLEAYDEKEDPGEFVIPIQLEGKINLNAVANTGFDINVMPYLVYMEIGSKTSLDTTESDNDDEEEYVIQINKFGASIYRPKPARQWKHMKMKPNPHDPNDPDDTRRWRKLCFHVSITRFCFGKGCGEAIDNILKINVICGWKNEEIFTSEAWMMQLS
nr:hypothetical protein [Tanacetum cinerariifolium]